MKKISKSQSGFTAVEGLLIVLILVVLGGIGYMVYHNNHKAKTTNTTSSSTSSTKMTDVYADWTSFADSSFTFRYPANWHVNEPGTEGADTPTDASLIGSKASIPSYINSGDTTGTENLNFSFFTSLADPSDCNNSSIVCTAKIVTPLTTKGLANPKLVVFSQDNSCPQGATCGLNNIASYEVIDSANEKAGDTTIPEGLTVDGKTYQLVGCSLTISTSSASGDPICGAITDYQAFQASAEYKDLVNVLDSLTIR